jgi:hypothetical protein
LSSLPKGSSSSTLPILGKPYLFLFFSLSGFFSLWEFSFGCLLLKCSKIREASLLFSLAFFCAFSSFVSSPERERERESKEICGGFARVEGIVVRPVQVLLALHVIDLL